MDVNKMAFLFLDIDGVLNAEPDFKLPKKAPWLKTSEEDIYNGISQPRVARLARIVEETGAKIVLVSSWKAYYHKLIKGEDDLHVGKYLTNSLSRKRLRIYDTTYGYEHRGIFNRGYGILCWILNWVKEHPDQSVGGIVILDDEEFDYEEQGLKDWVVLTDYYGDDKNVAGLTDSKAQQAIDILRSGKLPTKLKLTIETKKKSD